MLRSWVHEALTCQLRAPRFAFAAKDRGYRVGKVVWGWGVKKLEVGGGRDSEESFLHAIFYRFRAQHEI